MPNEFIARNGIISRGNLIVSGSLVTTQPTTFSGSLSLAGDLNFQAGATRYISMSAAPTAGNGSNLVMQGGDANTGGQGGSLYFRVGLGAGGPGYGSIYIGNQAVSSVFPVIELSGPTTIYNSGPNTGTVLTVNGGGQLAMRYDWDNINLVTSAVSSASRILRFTGASQYQVRGSGTTSSTTAFQVQNANASSSFLVRDDSTVTIGSGYAKTINLSPEYGGTRSRISGGYGNGYLEFGGAGYGNVSKLADNEIQVASDAYPQSLSIGPAGTSQNIGAFNYSIKSGSATHFFVSSSGNVGVGTTSPSASFTVNNTDVIFGSNAGYGFYYGAANDGTFQVKANGSETVVWLRPVGNSQNFGSDYWSSLQTAAASLKVLSGQYGNLYFGAGSNTLLTIYNPTSGAGHVGIGTTTPHYKLQIVGTAYSGSFNANDQVVINTAGNMGVGTTAPTARLQAKGSGTTSSTTALLVQNANASSSLAVLDNGYVGIGTSSPAYNLDIAGTVRTTGASTNGVVFSDGTYAAKAYMSSYIFTIEKEGTYGPSNYLFKYNDGTAAISLSNNTTILGIGGGDDAVMMSRNVYAPHNAAFGFTSYGATTKYKAIQAVFTDNSTSGVAFNYKSGSADTEGIRLTSAGNVGIGTTTPTYKLDVSGSTRLNGTGLTTGQHTVATLGFTLSSAGVVSSIGNSYINIYPRGTRTFDIFNPGAGNESTKLLIGNFVAYGVETARYTSAMLVLEAETRGTLLTRTGTTANISSPGQGLITYVTASATEGLYYYNSGSYQAWTRVLNDSGSQNIAGNLTVTGSFNASSITSSGAIINGNLTVIGTASFTYTTASVVNIGGNLINLNTDNPAARFGGMTVTDSGSFGTSSTGSLLWDSQNNRWIYSNPSGSSYDGGLLISGPRNTSGLGSEEGTTLNALMKGQGGDHITSSGVFEVSGSVGIGISSPNAGLEVANAEQSTFRITRNNNTGNYG